MTTTRSRSGSNGPARHAPADLLLPPRADDTEVIAAVEVEVEVEVAVARTPRHRGTTTIPAEPEAPAGSRRRTGDRPPGDLVTMAAAALGGLAVAFLLFGLVAPLAGRLGFVLVAWAAFVGLYAVLTSLDDTGPVVRDRVMSVVLMSVASVLFGSLVLVVGFVVLRGARAMFHLNFYTQDQSTTGPLDPLTKGGVLHALVGTLEMMAICLVVTVPLGIACAVFIAIVKGPGSRFVRTIVEAMTALPSIVAGLFVLATWILLLGNEKSGLAAAFALSVMMLPIIIRAADVVLRLVPGTLLEASEALGAPRWRTVLHVVLPTSKSGLATAVILGTARGIGETSPVLLTAGFTQAMNVNPLSGPMVSLPLAAFNFTRSPQPDLIARGFGTAALLLLLVLVLFVLARLVGGRGAGQLSNRQRRRVARRSADDARRFDARAAHAPTVAPDTTATGTPS